MNKEIGILFYNVSRIIIDTHYKKLGSDRKIGEYYKDSLLVSLPEDFNILDMLRTFNKADYPTTIEDISYENLLEFLSSLINNHEA